MNDFQREFWSIIRSFAIRYNEYNRQKGASSLQLEECELIFSKILSERQLMEVVINKITSVQLKSDYHNLLMLNLLQEFVKWSLEYHQELKEHSGPTCCILTQSISLLNNQKQYHTLFPKQNQLIASLLPHPNTMENLEGFSVLYFKLKDIKDFYSTSIREHQKQCFLKAVQQCILKANELKNIKVIEFIFDDIFNELLVLQETHEYVSQRLKILKKILKYLWIYHQNILYQTAYLLMRYSYKITANRQLFINVIPIYQILLDQLINMPSIVPLITYKHIVFKNIDHILKNGGNFIQLQILLSQISNIFTRPYLEYFMKNYDWNFMEVSICQQSLNLLYQYSENRTNQKKYEFELTKIYINRIQSQIKIYLQEIRAIQKDKNKWKFYQVKKKQYLSLILDLNKKPKHVFKRIQAIQNQIVREETMQRYVRLIKKSPHIQNRSMIDIFSTDNSTSAKLFSYYVEIVLKQCKEYNLEQFMRLFTSNFFLTGESQQIGRVMDTITQLYYRHQESENIILKSSDATYTFANAILILNTDLHNPKNEQKMSQQNFIKMCKKINEGADLPQQVIKKTYKNIKMNKINTFRDRGDMLGISLSNWLILCTDYQSLPLLYYDHQMQALDDHCLQFFIMDTLTFIIDEKQTAKLELLVERFVYEEKIFQCQIIEIIRRIVDKKSHIPLHILQKIQQICPFKNTKANNQVLSFYWLGANIIISFSHLIPTNLICEFLVNTWSLRIELQDNLYLKLSGQIKRIKQCLKQIAKRDAKKSIINMFSNFLSFTQSDQEIQVMQNDINRRTNFKSLSNSIFEIIRLSESHRILSIQFLVEYIRNQQSKLYEQFVSCMYLTFNLLYHTQGSQKMAEDLFFELLGIKQGSITKRLENLGKKQNRLYNNIINYIKYWILKLLLKQYHPSKLANKLNNNYQILLNKSLQYLQKVNKDIFQDLLKQILSKDQISTKMYEVFEKAILKIYSNENLNEIQASFAKFQKKQVPVQNKEINEQTNNVQKAAENIELVKQDLKQLPLEKKTESLRSGASEQFINPDAMMEQIEHQIEQHLKSSSIEKEKIKSSSKQTLQHLASDEHKQINKKNDTPSPANSLKSQENPLLPVVMF